MNIKIIKILVSLCSILLVLFVVSANSIVSHISSITIDVLLSAGSVVFLSILLTSYRFVFLSRRLDMDMSFRTAHFINIISILSGMFFFNVIGQMVSRTSVGSSYLSHVSRMAILTLFEKVISLLSLLGIATLGVLLSAFPVHKDIYAHGHFKLIVGFIVLIAIAIWFFALLDGQRRYIKRALWALHALRLDYTLLITIATHLMTLFSYVVMGHFFLPDVSLLLIASAFAIVMFSASLPISFAGWGIRELTASAVFTGLSLDPGVGVAVAAMIGVISLVMLGAHAFISSALLPPDKPTIQKMDAEGRGKVHVERALAFFGGIAIAVLAGIQMRVSTNVVVTTVNLADPFALVLGLTFVAFWYTGYREQKIWRVPNFNIGLLLFCLTILMGWINGYFTYGGNSWASINRVFGLIIIFSYLASGAFFVAFFGRLRAVVLLQIMVIAASIAYAVFLLDAKFALFSHQLTYGILDWAPERFNGFVLNRNAFALQMLLIFSILLVVPRNRIIKSRNVLLAIVAVLLLASGSRTGVISAGVVLALSIYMKFFDLNRLARVGGVFAGLLVAQWLFISTQELWNVFGVLPDASAVSKVTTITNVTSSNLANTLIYDNRIASYIGGVNMWFENILIGGGLGAYIESQGATDLVIHNSLLWVLAEMGIVGFAMSLYLPIRVASHALRDGLQKAAWEDAALILCLISILLFSLAHEITYQRLIWFIIGVLVANKWRITLKS